MRKAIRTVDSLFGLAYAKGKSHRHNLNSDFASTGTPRGVRGLNGGSFSPVCLSRNQHYSLLFDSRTKASWSFHTAFTSHGAPPATATACSATPSRA